MKTRYQTRYPLLNSRLPDVVWLDIETRKVPAPADWLQKTRWEPFMIGVAYREARDLVVEVRTGTEGALIEWARGLLAGRRVCYSATREFDEMVLRGRFTNARRAHSPVPGDWPHLDGAPIRWENIRKTWDPAPARAFDVASRDVPAVWKAGDRDVVTLHCARDVMGLILRDPTARLAAPIREALETFLI